MPGYEQKIKYSQDKDSIRKADVVPKGDAFALKDLYSKEEFKTEKDALSTMRGTNTEMEKEPDQNSQAVIVSKTSYLSRFMVPYTESVKEPPIYESNVRSPKGGGLSMEVHSFVGLRFTSVDPVSGQMARYRIRAGFVGNRSVGDGRGARKERWTWFPGGLRDDSNTPADITVERRTTSDVIEDAIQFIPEHARNSRYHLLFHNCNHFAREVAQYLGFGDIADLHKGTSPSTVFSTIYNKAQSADEDGKIKGDSGLKVVSDRVSEDKIRQDHYQLGISEQGTKVNGNLTELNSGLLSGTTGDKGIKMPLDSQTYEQEAIRELNLHTFLNFRFNGKSQFKTKNSAKRGIHDVARDIRPVQDDLDQLNLNKESKARELKRKKLIESGTAPEEAKPTEVELQSDEKAKQERIERTTQHIGTVMKNSYGLMKQSGKRYYHLGVYSMTVVERFRSLINRLSILAENPSEITGFGQVPREAPGTVSSDAKVLELFSENIHDNENQDVQRFQAGTDKTSDVFLADSVIQRKRGDFIVKNIPRYNEMVSAPLHELIEEQERTAKFNELSQGEREIQARMDQMRRQQNGQEGKKSDSTKTDLVTEVKKLKARKKERLYQFSLERAVLGLRNTGELVKNQPEYMKAVIQLYTKRQASFPASQLAYMLTQELVSTLDFLTDMDEFRGGHSLLDKLKTAGSTVLKYGYFLNEENVSEDQKKEGGALILKPILIDEIYGSYANFSTAAVDAELQSGAERLIKEYYSLYGFIENLTKQVVNQPQTNTTEK